MPSLPTVMRFYLSFLSNTLYVYPVTYGGSLLYSIRQHHKILYILILLICVHLLGLSAPSFIRHSVVISNYHRNMPAATHINASDQSPGKSVHEKSQSKKATSNPSHSPPIQWKCSNCNYVNYSDIAEAVYADSEDGARRCVNCALVNTKL